MKILVLEDEIKIGKFIHRGFSEQGFTVDHCTNGDDACILLLNQSYDIAILDIMTPGRDGLSILKKARKQGIKTPILILTARSDLEDRLDGLNLGADDYLTKPFYMEELIARTHAVLRRHSGYTDNLLRENGFELDRLKRTFKANNQTIELSSREFNLLEYLMRSPDRVLTRTQILEHLWGYDFDPCTNLVDVCIKRIRKKIHIDGENSPIETVRGVGYRFKRRTVAKCP